jgi:hypothetical protein
MYKAIRFYFPASYTFSATEHVNTEKHIENLPLREEKKEEPRKWNRIGNRMNWNFRFQDSKINEVVMSGDEQREGDV